MNIVLTGFMGTGKTVVGALLAEKLGWERIDVDALVEKSAGIRIADIFARFGEPHFRDLETAVIRAVSLLDRKVISTGGGAVLRPENMDALEQHGRVICLTASPAVIVERLKGDDARPLLRVPDPLAKVSELLAAREPFYRRCAVSIDTSASTPAQIAQSIITSISL